MIASLACDRAANTSGTIVTIDGGLSAAQRFKGRLERGTPVGPRAALRLSAVGRNAARPTLTS
ncbi:hypothetical protein [Nocardia sp. NPDC051463]|uniref:hypothetical protein n=1 Tax=Nocardia sp. NPDC051463 TaxID=3154845 RepID=UPI003447C46C